MKKVNSNFTKLVLMLLPLVLIRVLVGFNKKDPEPNREAILTSHKWDFSSAKLNLPTSEPVEKDVFLDILEFQSSKVLNAYNFKSTEKPSTKGSWALDGKNLTFKGMNLNVSWIAYLIPNANDFTFEIEEISDAKLVLKYSHKVGSSTIDLGAVQPKAKVRFTYVKHVEK